MRGGVSFMRDLQELRDRYSPHAWGCFFPSENLFISYISCIPHMRGGVSDVIKEQALKAVVFPTCLGVLLSMAEQNKILERIPHMRGGVSTMIGCINSLWVLRIPHMRGGVSGTNTNARLCSINCIPHMRGGVS